MHVREGSLSDDGCLRGKKGLGTSDSSFLIFGSGAEFMKFIRSRAWSAVMAGELVGEARCSFVVIIFGQ
jgi:hypothetical protein